MNEKELLRWVNDRLASRSIGWKLALPVSESGLDTTEHPIIVLKNDKDLPPDERVSDVFDYFCIKYDDFYHLFQWDPEFLTNVCCEYIALTRLGDDYFLWRTDLPLDASSPHLLEKMYRREEK